MEDAWARPTLSAQVANLQRMLFGPRSARMPTIDEELRRTRLQPEVTVDGDPMPNGNEERKRELRRHSRRKSKPRREANKQSRKELPTHDIEVDVHPQQLPRGMARERAAVFRFDPSRSAAAAETLLGAGEGNLCIDGYSGYNSSTKGQRARSGCWAHARRKVFKALGSAPHAQELLGLIRELCIPEAYLADVFVHVAARCPVEPLMPWNWTPHAKG
jgi:hypothetical protein